MGRNKQIVWTARAQQDVIDARTFLRAVSLNAAKAFTSRIRDAVGKLKRVPAMGAPIDVAPLPGEFRSVVVGDHRVIYRIDRERVLIYRVWDCRRDPAKMWEH